MRPQPKPRSTFTVSFAGPKAGPPQPVQGRVPRVARLLAQAHRINALIRADEFQDLADAARAIGVTQARMTQIMNLLLLAPAIQEEIVLLPPVTNGRDPVTERQLRPIVAEPDWQRQGERWSEVKP